MSSVSESFHEAAQREPEDPEVVFEDAERCRALPSTRACSRRRRRRTTDGASRRPLTLFLGLWPHAYLLQVGDSRCYVFQDGELTQITRDQTMAQDLVDSGALTRTVAEKSRWAHILSSAMGGEQAAPVVTRVVRDWGTVVLLCSDGLTKHVSDERIRERLAMHDRAPARSSSSWCRTRSTTAGRTTSRSSWGGPSSHRAANERGPLDGAAGRSMSLDPAMKRASGDESPDGTRALFRTVRGAPALSGGPPAKSSPASPLLADSVAADFEGVLIRWPRARRRRHPPPVPSRYSGPWGQPSVSPDGQGGSRDRGEGRPAGRVQPLAGPGRQVHVSRSGGSHFSSSRESDSSLWSCTTGAPR